MTVNKAVQRLHNDLSRLHKAERELKGDRKDLGQDRQALKQDRRALERDRSALGKERKDVARGGKSLDKTIATRDAALKDLAARKQDVIARLAADTFDYDTATEGVQQDPALLGQLDQLTQRESDTRNRFGASVDDRRAQLGAARDAVSRTRSEIQDGRHAVKQDAKVLKKDHRELKGDHRAIQHARHQALKHLRPAEYHLSLKHTNVVRRDLGLKAVHAPIRPGVPNVVGGQVGKWIAEAQTILKARGISLSQMNARDIATIIRFESGGNPSAQNNWDSNAQAGTPSIGLMQTIGPTFNAYKLPGHGNIRNPVDNIIAGVRYAISRYGSIGNVPGIRAVHAGGSYVGY